MSEKEKEKTAERIYQRIKRQAQEKQAARLERLENSQRRFNNPKEHTPQ
jgi:Flp pilus assembly protein TadB